MKERMNGQPKFGFEDGLANDHTPRPLIASALIRIQNYQPYVIWDPTIRS